MTSLKLNEEQLKAIKFGTGPLLIIAGAGTGKTTVITERIKRLIFSKKVKPEEILALTLPKKQPGKWKKGWISPCRMAIPKCGL